MKIPKLLARAATLALVPGALLFGTADKAHAIAVFFTPPGSQIDSDPINDLVLQPGSTQPFQFNLDLPLLGAVGFAGQDVTAFQYVLSFDASEWVPQQSSIDACNGFVNPLFSCATAPLLVPGAPAIGSGVTNQFVITLTAAPGQGIVGGAPVFAIGGPIVGDVGASLPNNGDADLLGSLISITIGGNTLVSTDPTLPSLIQTSVFGSQSISIQAEKVPGPLPLLGAGAAFGYSRRLRKRVKGVASKPVQA